MLTAHKCINCTEGNPSEKQSTSRLLIALRTRVLLLCFHFLIHFVHLSVQSLDGF